MHVHEQPWPEVAASPQRSRRFAVGLLAIVAAAFVVMAPAAAQAAHFVAR
jgi:hypothetical protein